MKILLVHNRYKQVGGEDTVFHAEKELLIQNGHEVDTLLYDNNEIKSTYDKILSGLKAFYNTSSADDIKEKIASFRPDVIHVHNFLPLVSPSVFFVAKKRRVPVILTLHNYRLICPSSTLFHNGRIYEKSIHSFLPLDAIWKGVYRNSRMQTAAVALMTAIHNALGTWRTRIACYIALTQFARQKICDSKLRIPGSKFFVKPNFTQNNGYEPIDREDFFIYIGRLSEEKGLRTLLKACDLFPFKLIIVGDGPLRGLVEQAAMTNSNINYIGFVSKQNVLQYMSRCKALIFPSTWYEGFPMTIVEAFSTGTPVIASDLGSMSEIIQHEVNGLHFRPGDERDLILRINELSQNTELAKRVSINARSSYERFYTPEQNYKQLMGIYKNAIQQRAYPKPWSPWYSLTQSKHW
jgi:glycosyltransferase involved in cell wall biosynthesis